jgi:ubiquinone/menaquinone biosynthesis C-methylase UbiE
MEAQLMKRVQRYGWDKAAIHYESAWQQQLKPAQDLLLEMANIQDGEQVLDIACGTGLVTFKAAEKAGYVLGTDISDGMIELARNVSKEKAISNIAFERMDAEKLELKDESFDVVLCALGLMYVPDPFLALSEIKRVLKPGGRMIAAVWGNEIIVDGRAFLKLLTNALRQKCARCFFNSAPATGLNYCCRKWAFKNLLRIESLLFYLIKLTTKLVVPPSKVAR